MKESNPQPQHHNPREVTPLLTVQDGSVLEDDNNVKCYPTATNNDKEKVLENEADFNAREETKWLWTTIALALSLLVQSYLLVSVFPYSGFLAMHLVPNLNEETAGKYAGWIASSFMFGRTFSSYHWGKAADIYGRTFVIKSSLLLSAFFSTLFGLSTSFGLALFWRFLMGLSNGLIGPVKTLVSEICGGNQQRETKSLAIIFGMWGYGFLLNPAISGYLSDPIKQYPHFEAIQPISGFLTKFPYFVPNLIGTIYCLAAYLMVSKCVEETLPEHKRKAFNILEGPKQLLRNVSSIGLFKHLHTTNPDDDVSDSDTSDDDGEHNHHHHRRENLPKWVRPSPSTTALTILSHKKDSSNDENEQQYHNTTPQATICNLWSRKTTRQHLVLYWFFSFVVISIDEIFPLFCISKDSGLGVQESQIGNILTGTGIFYVIIQYVMVTQLVDAFGYYTTMRIGTLCSLPFCILIPISLLTNRNASEGELTLSTMSFLSVVYAIIRAFSSVTFSTITMTTNRTVPTSHRATMNGLSMLGGSLAKGLGPAFAGILFSSSAANITAPFGSVFVYAVISILGIGIFVQSLYLPEQHSQEKSALFLSEDEKGKSPEQEGGDSIDEEQAPSF